VRLTADCRLQTADSAKQTLAAESREHTAHSRQQIAASSQQKAGILVWDILLDLCGDGRLDVILAHAVSLRSEELDDDVSVSAEM
jgi:hypothetical protein